MCLLLRGVGDEQCPTRASPLWTDSDLLPNLCPVQLSCLANLAARLDLQDDFEFHPPNLLLFYK